MIGAMFELNIKYDNLDLLLDEYLTNVKYSNNVNVIIDLKSIFKKAYRTDLNNIISDQKIAIEDLSSFVINLIGHYRNYLYKKGKYSSFYLLYSSEECELMKELNRNYKRPYYDKYFIGDNSETKNMNNIVRSANKQVKILSKYIPDVFYIETSKYDEMVYANYLVRNIVNKNDINILLSNDPIMYQILNAYTFALDIKGNKSQLITEANAVSYFIESESKFSGNLLNLILSITGDDSYGINKIHGIGYKRAYKIISKLFEEGKLVDKSYLKFPAKILSENEILLENIDAIESNYSILFPIDKQIENIIDIQSSFSIAKPPVTMDQFKELNNRIFLMYPLNLASLLRGEKI